MAQNGKLPKRMLKRITGGNGLVLEKDAAKAWNAFAKSVRARHGIRVRVNSAYRPLGRPGDGQRYKNGGPFTQWAAWELYQSGQGALAARPGTSNHGWGKAVDVPPATQNAINSYGRPFGFSKEWSDAPSEPWHFLYNHGKASKRAIARWSQIYPGQTARYKDTGPGIVSLRKHLRRHGFMPFKYGLNNKRFTRALRWWLKRFQRAKGLRPDGVAGPQTWRALRAKESSPSTKPTPKPKPAPKPKPKPKPVSKNARLFADISNHQRGVDIDKYAKAGHRLIALKASEGATFKDATFNQRWKEARAAGLNRWAYHFCRPGNGNTPAAEAANFCAMVKAAGGMRKGDRLVLDYEDPGFNKDGTKWIEAFCKEVGRRGYTVSVLYSGGWYLPGRIGKYWPKNHLGRPLLYWHAAYNEAPTKTVPAVAKKHLYAIQYTDGKAGSTKFGPKGAQGIGACDMNFFYKQ